MKRRRRKSSRDTDLVHLLSDRPHDQLKNELSVFTLRPPLFADAVTRFPVPEVGSAMLQFSDGENAIYSDSLDGVPQSKSIKRFVVVRRMRRSGCVRSREGSRRTPPLMSKGAGRESREVEPQMTQMNADEKQSHVEK